MSTLRVEGIKNAAASSDAITLAVDGTCIAKATNKPGRNLLINGACKISQRATSSTATGYATVDRVKPYWASHNAGTITQSQSDVASGNDCYNAGFRKAYKVAISQAGNTSAGALYISGYQQSIEAQDIAQSGWKYWDPNSKLTLTFWIKSTTSDTFQLQMHVADNTQKKYNTPVSATTSWTKITKVIPGHADINFNNDNGKGLTACLVIATGADMTGTVTQNTWVANTVAQVRDTNISTWLTAGAGHVETTGWQLEVGDTSTDYEYRSYGDELLRCQRYYLIWADHTLAGGDEPIGCSFYNNGNYKYYADCRFPVEMRANASVIVSNSSNHFRTYGDGAGANCDTLTYDQLTKRVARVGATTSLDKKVAGLRAQAGGYLHFNAEL